MAVNGQNKKKHSANASWSIRPFVCVKSPTFSCQRIKSAAYLGIRLLSSVNDSFVLVHVKRSEHNQRGRSELAYVIYEDKYPALQGRLSFHSTWVNKNTFPLFYALAVSSVFSRERNALFRGVTENKRRGEKRVTCLYLCISSRLQQSSVVIHATVWTIH